MQKHNIHFSPGVNEDLAATAVWGSQQAHLVAGAKYDGVFAMWYGKGPGVDRSMDVIKHANAFGTTKHGGVLAIAGDDHACKSSTVPHQSEHMFIGAAAPVLNPANVQEVLDYGIIGWAMSRYSGCWVALKAITENMDSAISADLDAARVSIKTPQDFAEPPGGLNAQWPTTPLEQERLLHKYRIYAARAFALANDLNRVTLDTPNPRLGIVTGGKSHLDVMEALHDLGIDDNTAAAIGIRIYKVGMSWPLEPVATHRFARGLSEILVVEEKRGVIENQLVAQLYNWSHGERPVVVGEFDERGNDLVTNLGELTPAIVARAIGDRVNKFYESTSIRERLAFLDAKQKRVAQSKTALTRTPYFCSGCPHNTSTRVPEGSVGMAGIGCHYMVKWMNRNTETFTQMGGEGASWIGIAPFVATCHVFQNIGDGTYFHSGILAIRAAIAAGVNITYKVLLNDAVAMTGGQAVDGTLSLDNLVAQLRAEGLSESKLSPKMSAPQKQNYANNLADGIGIHSRSEFDRIQIELREVKGTSVIVYDQTCAAEKRRRRKRGTLAESATRVFINDEVCEGCGDCSTTSNCLSVLPKQTETGVKRQIDQSACNKDLTCLDGFCPSFVTVTGDINVPSINANKTKNATQKHEIEIVLPEPARAKLNRPWNILVTGIGGTGVLTVGSLIALAAHLEGKGCATLNQTGLAQKFGAVVSHVRIAESQDDIHAVRIPEGDADLLLGCDLVVSAMPEALARLDSRRSHSVVNAYENPTADFIHDADYAFPNAAMQRLIAEETGAEKTAFVNATKIARDLLGDAIGGNLFLLGYACQRGLIPVGVEAINQAIALNNVAVEFNQQAFLWGRRAAVNLEAVQQLTGDTEQATTLTDLNEIIEWRYNYLTKYQNKKYADRYRELIKKVEQKEKQITDDELKLTKAVAKNYFQLLAYKDEYEIARLYSNGDFIKKLKTQFPGKVKINFHLAPPIFARKNKLTGNPIKQKFPQVTLKLFRLLAAIKFLRQTKLDPFGYTNERKQERQLITNYEFEVKEILQSLTKQNHQTAIAIAKSPELIKGFGHIKTNNIKKYNENKNSLLKKFTET